MSRIQFQRMQLQKQQAKNLEIFAFFSSLLMQEAAKTYPFPAHFTDSTLDDFLRENSLEEIYTNHLSKLEPTLEWLADEQFIHLKSSAIKLEGQQVSVNIKFTLTEKGAVASGAVLQDLQPNEFNNLFRNTVPEGGSLYYKNEYDEAFPLIGPGKDLILKVYNNLS
ncbi:hypothetical protein [Pseudoalteromonas piscicida]|uniref:hypothetical protein n=1 Tax=Pseudoalteromonas piscicida TaxID=43662 RepID=UPI000A9AB99B|nr:hypothetical protein [Pseudoalteromonas piscicida]